LTCRAFRILCPLLWALGCGSPGEPEATPTLRFSAIPDQNTTRLRQKFDPIADYLAQALGVPVEYVPATDYTASVEMFRNGDIQLAWFGGLTGVQARHAVPGANAIAQGVEDPEYKAYFIAHAATGLARSEAFPLQIASLSFSFGSEASTSGRLMPEYFIRQHAGMTLEAFFAKPYAFSGAHDKTAKLVESGQVQAGVLSYKTYDALVERGEIDPSVARIIWETPPFADYNFTAHPSLETTYGAGFTGRLKAALLAMKDPALLGAFPRSGLIAATNNDFTRVESVARSLEMVR
jgi:phosphonate transport system substrate-binding protein